MTTTAANATSYAETIALIERLHRRFLDLLRVELERLGVGEINNIQALLLANIGDDEVSVGELMSRGYYLGSNVSYNLKRLVATGLVAQERSRHDRRVVRVRLTDRGQARRAAIARILARHAALLAGPSGPGPLIELNRRLADLEAFWSHQVDARPSYRSMSALGEFAEQHLPAGAAD